MVKTMSRKQKHPKPWFIKFQVFDLGNFQSVSVLLFLDGLTQIVKQQRTALACVSGNWIVGGKALRAIQTDQNSGTQKLKQLLAKGLENVTIDGEKLTTAEAVARYLVTAFPQLVASSQEAPVVMTFPTNSPAAVVEATMNALKAAGINLMTYAHNERVFGVDEATAFLTSGIRESNLVLKDGDLIIGIDLGGVTGDLTAALVRANKDQVILDQQNWTGSAELGGIRFDEHLYELIKRRHKLPPHSQAAGLAAANAVKTTFSDPQVSETTFDIGDESFTVSRTELIEVAKPFFDELKNVLNRLLLNLPDHPIAYVIIGGGFANLWAAIPEFEQRIKELCGETQIRLVEEPEYATAKGAGLLVLQEFGLQTKGPILRSRTRHDIYLATERDDDRWCAIEAGTPMPAESGVKQIFGKSQVRVIETLEIGGKIHWLSPSRFNFPRGHNHIAVTRDYTGIQILSGESEDDLEPNRRFRWTFRPEAQERMAYYDNVLDRIQRRGSK